jgi:phage shock protein C
MTEQNPDQNPSRPEAEQPPAYSGNQPPPAKRLVRTRDDRWLGGVCGGIARYTGLDSNLVRLLVVLGTVLGFGALILAYIVAWIVIPEE